VHSSVQLLSKLPSEHPRRKRKQRSRIAAEPTEPPWGEKKRNQIIPWRREFRIEPLFPSIARACLNAEVKGRRPSCRLTARHLDVNYSVWKTAVLRRVSRSYSSSVPEMTHAGEDHGHVALVGGGNCLVIADRAAWLDCGGCARFGSRD